LESLAFFEAQNCPENSGLPRRFRARKITRSMVEFRISKDALSYWNFSNLWEILGIKKGIGELLFPPYENGVGWATLEGHE
jgi:hypothetical protein